MKFIKDHYRLLLYIVLLLVIFFVLNIYQYDFDPTGEYGMCHAFRMGEIPYKDFNIVTTPLFVFLFSLGLFIKDHFFVFLFEAILLNIIVFYFVDKVLEKKSFIFVACMSLLCFLSFVPTYNFLTFSIILLLICFEKLKYSDKLIGLFWGLMILSKHTIGLPIVFVVLIGLLIKKYDIKKIFERIIFMFIPFILFLIYLLITNSLSSFIDLAFMGLFAFASSNHIISSLSFIIVGCLLMLFYLLYKDRKNTLYYYALGSIMFVIPIADFSHFVFFFLICSFIIIDKYCDKFALYKLVYCLILFFIGFTIFIYSNRYSNLTFCKYNHYQYVLTDREFIASMDYLNSQLEKYDNYYVIDSLGMYYDIIHDRKITYYDVPLHGNFGYRDTKKFIDLINSEKDCYFVITHDKKHMKTVDQFDVDALNYIKDNFEKVETIGIFSVYYKK